MPRQRLRTAEPMPPSGDRGPVVAVVDVGSNSLKLTVATLRDGQIEQLRQATETVRLGLGVGASGHIAPDRVAAALTVLRRYAAEARALGATRLLGVATAAVRDAANGAEFVALARQTGWDLRTISGNDEAVLSFRGLAAMLDLAGEVVVADIGGGSTEVTIAEDGAIRLARSLPLGSGSLTERHAPRNPPTAAELAACRAVATTLLAALPLPRDRGLRLIATGGTGEYMARLLPDGTALDQAAVDVILVRLQELTAAELARRIAIPEARARVLPAGVAVVGALAALAEPAHIVVAPSGLRLGLLLEAFSY